MEKVVLAYSGGLDTSVLIPWLREKYDFDVITLTANLGSDQDLDAIRAKALRTGASEAFIEDVRDVFVRFFCWPALQSGALYEGVYPPATALARFLKQGHAAGDPRVVPTGDALSSTQYEDGFAGETRTTLPPGRRP